MNIADMIKLSVGGYTKDQIKEMNTLSKDCPELLDFATKQGKTFDEVKELFDFSKELDGGTQPPEPKQDPDTGKSDRDAELEKKIEELTKQNKELNNSIKQLQSQNLHTDQGGNQPPDFIGETLGQIVASYM